MKVLFDTNALLLPFTQGTDLGQITELVGAHEPVLPSVVADELERLSEGGGATARAAAGALRLSRTWTRFDATLPGDDGILETATDADVLVTNDKRLATEAKNRGLRVISSRGARLQLG